jgi:hypothetical protein
VFEQVTIGVSDRTASERFLAEGVGVGSAFGSSGALDVVIVVRRRRRDARDGARRAAAGCGAPRSGSNRVPDAVGAGLAMFAFQTLVLTV